MKYQRRRKRKIPCDYCLQDFVCVRFDARYCSAKCKERAYRDRLKPDPISVTEVTSGVVVNPISVTEATSGTKNAR